MARIVGGIGASHSPTIAFAKDTNKQNDPAWAPIFEGFSVVQTWVREKQVDVLFMIFNDHITSFFFDHYSAFALGIDDRYETADEGGGARDYPPVEGHLALSQHIGQALVADEFDMSFFQKKPLDHGFFSPLSMIAEDTQQGWAGTVVPLQVGVLQFPVPSARRCYKLGRSLRKAIQSFPEDLNVAIVATGGLSHQVHGERCGFTSEAWDNEFLELLQHKPEQLTGMRLAEYAEKGGMEGAEVIMWLIMRGALSDKVNKVHQTSYLPSMCNIATLIYEDLGDAPDEADLEVYREHIGSELAGVEKLSGTHPFTLARSHKAYRINDFLHRIVIPEHRARFVSDLEGLMQEYNLTTEEQTMIRNQQWIEMIHYGVTFFVLEKMAPVVGVSNIEVYASMRGESVEDFLKTRNAPIRYSVAGGDKASELDQSPQ
ncbi:gallate dioxygenase [Neptuniibacter halophilus]|uniref:gallate dioxygenase n=1 Tax=Neptuniibacter halophilus TaxID=651666 RepID=UPI0025733DB9|nr:gallate dioxygenase [Neptuniibacter halophilus]